MQVFKTYFRIIFHTLTSLIIYFVVFLGISILISRYNTQPTNTDFTETKIRIAIINRDGESSVVKGLTDFLSQKNTIVDIEDDAEKLQDALFFRKVDYIAIIPRGFSKDFKAGGSKSIEKVIVPGSTTSVYIDMQIDRYLHTSDIAINYSRLDEGNQLTLVSESMAAKADVEMIAKTSSNGFIGYIYYFNYFAYVMLSISILGISTIMIVFNQPDLRKRNLCSPLKLRSMNFQLVLGSATYSVACWLITVIFGIAIYSKQLLSSGLLPVLMLNSLVFTIVCTSIGFLVGVLIKSQNAQAVIVNVLSLGMSFICGVFVPQAILGKTVLRFASFLPAYWYIRANDVIGSQSFKTDYNKLLIPILIQIGFAIMIFSATLFISKQKRTANHTNLK
ncbi:MAG: ABC transporter permease [Oscillospiraceae bacterium]|nr:ABC transporter permease [Oscillospiraceae bacterium]MDD4414088.1 ABC transporter permease [Oscillospiraceae bacterium]